MIDIKELIAKIEEYEEHDWKQRAGLTRDERSLIISLLEGQQPSNSTKSEEIQKDVEKDMLYCNTCNKYYPVKRYSTCYDGSPTCPSLHFFFRNLRSYKPKPELRKIWIRNIKIWKRYLQRVSKDRLKCFEGFHGRRIKALPEVCQSKKEDS